MKNLFTFISILISFSLFSQVNYTANDQVPTYDKQFIVGINPGYNGPNWTDKTLADISFGNPNVGVEGIGMRTFRVPIPEEFVDFWGYEILQPAFQHYKDLGMKDLTVFLQSPSHVNKDTVQYCPGQQAQLFANLYEPIWDGGLNGTPVNDENYAALYIYRVVSMYGENVKFWEIWNEPDFGGSNCGWKPAGMPGNWFDNTPQPCETQLKAPVYHYIRLLKVAYEVIKSLDEDAYVCVGGIGFESYLDVLLRFTDNPVDGSVTAEFPLKGGAFFDGLSFHSYPHFNGTLLYYDSLTNDWLPRRHSDAAADGIINHHSRFNAVLDAHGYNGTTFPKKEVIITETGLPNKKFNDWIGSIEAQRNYVMKVQVAAYKNDIRQIDFYNLSSQAPYDQASGWLDVMGMYEQIENIIPYGVTPLESGIGCATLTQLLEDGVYDASQTALMNLNDSIRGAAFDMGGGEYRYALWAATKDDESETASYDYEFPSSIAKGGLLVHEWNFNTTGNVDSVFSDAITLSGSMKFIDQFEYVDTTTIVSTNDLDLVKNLNVLPNPFVEKFDIQFSLNETSDIQIELYDSKGVTVKTLLQKDLPSGQHQISVSANELPNGVYFGKIISQGKVGESFRVMKMK